MDSASHPAPHLDVMVNSENKDGAKKEEGNLGMELGTVVDPQKGLEIECRLEVQGQVRN